MKGSFPAPNPDDEKAIEYFTSNTDAKFFKARYDIALVLLGGLMPNKIKNQVLKTDNTFHYFYHLSFETHNC